MKKNGAPYGERHGKGKAYPDWLIEAVRMEFYDFDKTITDISDTLSIPYDTVKDWVGFNTRVHTNQEAA